MSLLGIDLGSSSVKIMAYSVDGVCIGGAKAELAPVHPAQGFWEQAPTNVWRAVVSAVNELMTAENLRKDAPVALAVSASGRENFPADENGDALANNIMGADIRGEEYEKAPDGVVPPEPWELACGHLRERMDPLNRFRWWNAHHPELLARAQYYPDWHGFLSLKLCGRNIGEPSMVARWAAFDLKSMGWNEALLSEYGFPKRLLPEVLPAGTPIAKILPRAADALGLPRELMVVTGGHDLNCAALGTGTAGSGTACLISGSYENMLMPTMRYPTAKMLQNGLSMTPHFGAAKRSVYAICPTGNAVLNWARKMTKLTNSDVAAFLKNVGGSPGPVIALPYVSGAMLHWEHGRDLRATLLGMTLATQPEEIVQAFMESIAYDHVKTLALLREAKIEVNAIRATGGGAKSDWWTQLKSDIMGVPVEVVAVEEPGTFGAALLAGHGVGAAENLDEASHALSCVRKTFEPNAERANLHKERMAFYNHIVPALNEEIFRKWR